MTYSDSQHFGNFIEGYMDVDERLERGRDRDTQRQRLAKQDERRAVMEGREDEEYEHGKSRRAITEQRQDAAYNQAESERRRQETIRKYRGAMAKFVQSKGTDYQDLLDALDDPDDDVNYSTVNVGPDGSLTISGEGQPDLQFTDLDHFAKMMDAELDPERWHQNRQAEIAQRAALAKEEREQKGKMDLEDRKGQWRIKLEEAKVRAGSSDKVPADLQKTQAIFRRLEKLYPKADPDKLWLKAYDKATESGDTPEQFKAQFIKSMTADLITEYSTEEEIENVKRMVAQAADEAIQHVYGERDEMGLAIPDEPEPQALPLDPAGVSGPDEARRQVGRRQAEQQSARAAEEEQRVITAARERFATPRDLYQHLMRKFPERGQRVIFEQVKKVFPDFDPNANRVSPPMNTPQTAAQAISAG